jgi:hypothetical protein
VPVGALLFSDDFDGPAGSKPDGTKWHAKTGQSGSSLATWAGLNQIKLDGAGNVVVEAVKSGARWDTGWLSGVAGHTGPRYIEARVKVAGGGIGPWNGAIWEWGYPFGAAPSIEVDVCEQLARESRQYHATLHWWNGAGNPQAGKVFSAAAPLADDFHRYGAAIYADRVDWYLDGLKVGSTPASAINQADLTVWKVVPNISLNMGGWGGTPTIPGPAVLRADYVRVWALAA